jgi:hypothetical protein
MNVACSVHRLIKTAIGGGRRSRKKSSSEIAVGCFRPAASRVVKSREAMQLKYAAGKFPAPSIIAVAFAATFCVDHALCFQPLVQHPRSAALIKAANAEQKISPRCDSWLSSVINSKDISSLDSDSGSGRDGKGPNGGRGWFFGKWGENGNGGRGGFSDGRWGIIPAAWAFDPVPRIFNSTVIEADTGIKFPATIVLNSGDQTGLQLLGGTTSMGYPLDRKIDNYDET